MKSQKKPSGATRVSARLPARSKTASALEQLQTNAAVTHFMIVTVAEASKKMLALDQKEAETTTNFEKSSSND